MKIRFRNKLETQDKVMDFTQSLFSPDEQLKQVAQRLHDNQNIHALVIENAKLYEKGMRALRQSVLGHHSLRVLSLYHPCISSYPVSVEEAEADYYFPKDLDKAVESLCAILRDGRLDVIELTDLRFIDRTERHYEHFDMVDPAVMRDLLLQEKQPFYIKEIAASLSHNPHLRHLDFSMIDSDTSEWVEKIEKKLS